LQADARHEGLTLEVHNLTKRFGDFVAVHDMSFRVPAGRFLTILGKSGSGKTTLLRMIAGFDTTGGGRIRIGEADVTELPPYKRDIGMVFQHHALFPHMSVAENIEFPLRQRRISRAQRQARVEEILAAVGLTALSQRRPSQLSGGEQQRVALARAVVFKPRILLMDEPLAALDKRSREQLQSEIRRLQRTLNITTLYVTHDQTEAFALSDLVAVMNAGRIEQLAAPRDIYESPQSEFVARFVGDSNVFTGIAVSTHSGGSGVRLTNGALIGCPTALVAGQPTTLLVRPEKLTLHVTHPGSSELNTIKAQVAEVLFYGELIEYRLRVDEVEIIARRQNAGEDPMPMKGENVFACWAILDTVVLS
jgi:putative spermidine/putrescine transport system ATP-binding protein